MEACWAHLLPKACKVNHTLAALAVKQPSLGRVPAPAQPQSPAIAMPYLYAQALVLEEDVTLLMAAAWGSLLSSCLMPPSSHSLGRYPSPVPPAPNLQLGTEAAHSTEVPHPRPLSTQHPRLLKGPALAMPPTKRAPAAKPPVRSCAIPQPPESSHADALQGSCSALLNHTRAPQLSSQGPSQILPGPQPRLTAQPGMMMGTEADPRGQQQPGEEHSRWQHRLAGAMQPFLGEVQAWQLAYELQAFLASGLSIQV